MPGLQVRGILAITNVSVSEGSSPLLQGPAWPARKPIHDRETAAAYSAVWSRLLASLLNL